MNAAIAGYTFGLFIMAFAISMILQFVLNKIPPLKPRLMVTYGISFVVGALLIVASADIFAADVFAGLLLFLAMLYFYRRDFSKRAK